MYWLGPNPDISSPACGFELPPATSNVTEIQMNYHYFITITNKHFRKLFPWLAIEKLWIYNTDLNSVPSVSASDLLITKEDLISKLVFIPESILLQGLHNWATKLSRQELTLQVMLFCNLIVISLRVNWNMCRLTLYLLSQLGEKQSVRRLNLSYVLTQAIVLPKKNPWKIMIYFPLGQRTNPKALALNVYYFYIKM